MCDVTKLKLQMCDVTEPVRALSSMSAAMSSREKGMDESSSSRKLWLAAVLLSTISCFMRASTSWLTVSVLYLGCHGAIC